MTKQFIYEFKGTILLSANTHDEADKIITNIDIDIDDYLTYEDLYQIDKTYIPTDMEKRIEKRETELHPLDDQYKYEQFKMRKYRYSPIFSEFLNGKIDIEEMIEKMDQAENKDIPDFQPFEEINMVELETKKHKRARLVAVN